MKRLCIAFFLSINAMPQIYSNTILSTTSLNRAIREDIPASVDQPALSGCPADCGQDFKKILCQIKNRLGISTCGDYTVFQLLCLINDKLSNGGFGPLNSKIDILNEEAWSIESKCEVISSKLDNLDLDITLSGTIVANIDLSTVYEKLDIIDNETWSIESKSEVISSKIDDLKDTSVDYLFTIESKVDVIDTDNEVLDSIDSKVDIVVDETWSIESKSEVISSKIDDLKDTSVDYLFTIESKIDQVVDETWSIESKSEVISSKIDFLASCDPEPVFESDAVGGIITLSTAGNYCLAEDVTATVTITADNVCLCMNNREVTGRIIVDAGYAKVTNGLVIAPAPTSAAEAQEGGIEITVNGSDARLENITVVCENTAGAFDGRSGITVHSDGSSIEKCAVQSGNAGDGNGGHGILCATSSINTHIRATDVTSTGAGANGGNGGDGIYLEDGTSKNEIRECTIANTGAGDGAGTDGLAINDQHTDTLPFSSIIYNNFAYNISNADYYEIRNKGSFGPTRGVDLLSGTPGSYSNVFVPNVP